MKMDLKKLNLKPQMGLSKREFLLVAFLIVAIEGYLLFTYFIQPSYIAYQSAMSDLKGKESVLSALKADFSRKEEMDIEIQKLESQMKDIEKQIPAYLSQEEVILLLDKLSDKEKLSMQTISFQNAAEIPLMAIKENQALPEKVDTGAAPTPMIIDQKVGITFTGSYDQVYSFLKDIEDNLRKVSVSGITIQRNIANDLSGMINLSFISYWDGNVGQKPFVMVPAPIPGKDGPFEPYQGYSANANQGADVKPALVRPDFYLMINSIQNNSAKVVLLNYYNSGSEASADTNGATKAQMTINGSNGTYTYEYTVGSYSNSGKAATEIKDGKIRMDVMVQPKISDQDKVGVTLDIANNTDVPFEITVKGDDAKSPRFILGKTTGNVLLK